MKAKIQNAFPFIPALALLPILVILGFKYPFYFDDAFISFRITQNFVTYGKPFFDISQNVNTSTSLLYPFWNVAWAILFGENWIENIPIVNGILMAFAFGVCCHRVNQWSADFPPLLVLLGCGFMLPIFLDFRNVLYGNSGLETSLYLVLISILAIPSPKMANRFPVFAWWLILLRPEGLLVGIGRCIPNLISNRNDNGLRSSLFWAFVSVFIWFLAGTILFESPIPQSLLAKSLHSINRLEEWKKGLGYILFVNHPIELAASILSFWLLPKIRIILVGPLSFLILYITFFSGIGAWWPWYVPPIFIPCAFIAGISAVGLLNLASEKITTKRNQIIGFLGLLLVVSGWTFFETYSLSKKLSDASMAYQKRNRASEKIGEYIFKNISTEKQILLEPIGLIGWYCQFNHFIDYPGLSNPKMTTYLEKRDQKIPHRLTDFKTDSAILTHFEPDYLLLWREEKIQFDKIPEFGIQYWEKEKLPYFPEDQRMDSVWIFEKLFSQPLN